MMITLQQILKALNLDPSASEDSMNKKLFMAKRLDISFHSISKLNHMRLMNRLTELRLEHNAFRRVPESINILTELEILNLAHNKIVDGFEYLPKNLKCLDMSFNRIKRITIKLPCPNLTLLDVSANPICKFSTSSETFRTKLIDSLPKLKWLNGDVVMPGERAGLFTTKTSSKMISSIAREYKRSKQDIGMLREMFERIDSNNDGYIDYEEMSEFARLTEDPELDIDDWTRITYYFSCTYVLFRFLRTRTLYYYMTHR